MSGDTADISATSDDTFSPKVDTVAVGTTVTWTNDDDEPTPPPRTPACGTADRSRPEPPPSWTFDEAGAYPYHCTFHGGPGTGMSGTVVVS